jgi:hypothetical protein
MSKMIDYGAIETLDRQRWRQIFNTPRQIPAAFASLPPQQSDVNTFASHASIRAAIYIRDLSVV